jgi:hypothetical protein
MLGDGALAARWFYAVFIKPNLQIYSGAAVLLLCVAVLVDEGLMADVWADGGRDTCTLTGWRGQL